MLDGLDLNFLDTLTGLVLFVLFNCYAITAFVATWFLVRNNDDITVTARIVGGLFILVYAAGFVFVLIRALMRMMS